MSASIMDLIAEAKSVVLSITPAGLLELMDRDDVIIVDVRDHPEVADTGKIAGAVHVTRGMLELQADEATPYYNPVFSKDKMIVLYCASGGRSALCGMALLGIGYDNVRNLGSFGEWLNAGGPIETACGRRT